MTSIKKTLRQLINIASAFFIYLKYPLAQLWKFLKAWNEITGFLIGFIGVLLVIFFFADPDTGTYEVAHFQKIFMVACVFFAFKGVAWISSKFDLPIFYNHLDTIKERWGNLSEATKLYASLLYYAVNLLALALIALAF